jgi:hypothetical protein
MPMRPWDLLTITKMGRMMTDKKGFSIMNKTNLTFENLEGRIALTSVLYNPHARRNAYVKHHVDNSSAYKLVQMRAPPTLVIAPIVLHK